MIKGKMLQGNGMWKPVLVGGLVGMAIVMLGSMVTASLMHHEKITESGMGYGVMITLMLASYGGAYISCRMQQGLRLVTGLLTGAMIFGILLGINGLVFRSGFQGIMETTLLVLCGCVLAAMWTSRRNGRGKLRKLKISNR